MLEAERRTRAHYPPYQVLGGVRVRTIFNPFTRRWTAYPYTTSSVDFISHWGVASAWTEEKAAQRLMRRIDHDRQKYGPGCGR